MSEKGREFIKRFREFTDSIVNAMNSEFISPSESMECLKAKLVDLELEISKDTELKKDFEGKLIELRKFLEEAKELIRINKEKHNHTKH